MSDCIKCGMSVPLESFTFCPFCGAEQVEKQKLTRKTKSRGNGQGSVYHRVVGGRPQQTWTVSVVVGWRQVSPDKPKIPIKRTQGGFSTKKEALDAIPSLKLQKSKTAPNLLYYWETYQKTGFKELSASKQTAYRIAWEKRLAILGSTRVDALTVQGIQDVLDNANLSYYQAKDCKNILSNMFKLAAADGFVNANLPQLLRLPKMEEEKEAVPFSPEEQKALWKAYEDGKSIVALPLLMIYTGMMPGEVRPLKVEQIDLENRVIRGAGLKTKTRKDTPVVIADFLVPVLQTLIDSARPDGHLFAQSKGGFYKLYYESLEKAGVRKLEPYSCRHTTATALAVTENVAPQTIRKVMRWSTAKMLDRYAHPDVQDALNAVDTLKKD